MRGSMVRWPEAGAPEPWLGALYPPTFLKTPNIPARREFSMWLRGTASLGKVNAKEEEGLTPFSSPTSCCLSVLPVCVLPWEMRVSIIRMSSVRTSKNPCSFCSSVIDPQPPSLLLTQGCRSESVWPGRRSRLRFSGTWGHELGSVPKQLVTLDSAFTAPILPAQVP